MTEFKIKEYTIHIIEEIYLWGMMFYGIPEGSEIQNTEELTSESMGFASIEEKTIFIYIPPFNKKEDYALTIAHEIGHIIEGGFKKNPAPRMNKLHEQKANHYENYFALVTEIVNTVENYLTNKPKRLEFR